MKTLAETLHDQGEFHDSIVEEFIWNAGAGCVTISVDDLNANFKGLPEYSGPIPGCLIFEKVCDVKVSIESLQERKFRIYAIEKTRLENEQETTIVVRLSPAGLLELRCS